ncbi:hypothetical protein D3C71_1321190 [compost metagenome]
MRHPCAAHVLVQRLGLRVQLGQRHGSGHHGLREQGLQRARDATELQVAIGVIAVAVQLGEKKPRGRAERGRAHEVGIRAPETPRLQGFDGAHRRSQRGVARAVQPQCGDGGNAVSNGVGRIHGGLSPCQIAGETAVSGAAVWRHRPEHRAAQCGLFISSHHTANPPSHDCALPKGLCLVSTPRHGRLAVVVVAAIARVGAGGGGCAFGSLPVRHDHGVCGHACDQPP